MKKGALIGRGRTAEVFVWGEHEALKLYYHEFSGTQLEWEYRIAQKVSALGLPTPSVSAVIEVEGRKGILYERIDGSPMTKELAAHPWKLGHYARMLASLHAQIHQYTVEDLPDMRQQLEQRIQNNPHLSADVQSAVLEVLHHLPGGHTLCHSDFHPENVLLSARGPVIIDWITASRCSPFADAARTSLILSMKVAPHIPMRWLLERLRSRFFDTYIQEYMKLLSIDRDSVKAWEVPMAAARLLENVPGEKEQLLTIIQQGLER